MLDLAYKFFLKTRKTGLYNIMPINNLKSVFSQGILSYDKVQKFRHSSVAMADIQDRRSKVFVTNGLELHKYANVYFDARNPMMYKIRSEDVCVLKISLDILDLPDVVVADRNASSSYVRFEEVEKALDILDYDLIYAEDWNDIDYFTYIKNKSIKCAEVLVPDVVDPKFILAVAVRNESDKKRLLNMGIDKKIYVDKHLFFG